MDEEPLYRTLEGNLPVRFIRLLPGTADDTVKKVELVHDHLRPFQNYEATSYTWGSPDDLDDVLCNARRRRLGKNAVDFLRRLRQPDVSRLLWMDCICINQDDLDERSRQVEIMNDIYRNANSVLIWLGDEGEDSDLIMSFASALDGKKYGQEAINTWLWWLDNSGLSAKSSLFDLVTPEAEGRRIARAAAALAQRSWLCRIWVQQAVSQSAVLSNFPFCVTAHGLMCLVPQVCEKGDYVGILAGFRWPVAMRKVGEPSRQQYELLGPCYVHRMMRGRCSGLVDEFRSKYRPGSEDESMRCDEQFIDDLHGRVPDESPCGFFPFNEKQDYARVRRVLGKRSIMLV